MKCTKIHNARAQPLFCSLNLVFSDLPVAFAVAVVRFFSSLFKEARRCAKARERINWRL